MKYILLVVSVLAGCATAPGHQLAYDGNLDEGKGLLLASVTREVKTVGTRLHTTRFYIKNMQTGKLVALASNDGDFLIQKSELDTTQGQHGRVVAFELAPGEYEMTGWEFIAQNIHFEPIDFKPFSFIVNKDEIDYLCNCHIKVIIGKNIIRMPIETGAQPEIYKKIDRDLAYLFARSPELKGIDVVDISDKLIDHFRKIYTP